MKLLRVVPWLALVAGCTFPPLDLDGRECPCLAGWTCNAENRCVRGVDASTDAGAVDGAIDAGPCHEEIVSIASTDDEGQFEHLTWEPDGLSGALRCGFTQGTDPLDQALSCYFRFGLPAAITSGATDVELLLELGAAGTNRWDPSREHGLWIALETSSDPVRPDATTTPPPVSGEGLTSAVRWPANGHLAWPVSSTRHRSPDLAGLLPTGTALAGRTIQIWVWGAFDTSDDAAVFVQLADGELEPRIVVRWCDR